MNMNDIILKKRNGEALSKKEIEDVIKGYTKGDIPDYQMSSLLMAIYFQKMNSEETFALTNAMRFSGDIIDLSNIKGIKVDKHSTGGVGDKVTLIVAPTAAACGVSIAKMSGRGLGFTGGTIDKLEAIPGFKTSLDAEDFVNQVNNIGIAVIGQTNDIAPADKKIYALRDVTGTVDNLSLISSSIMSKKLASGSDAIVLDVKCGKGAFMESEEDAIKLGKAMCEIGEFAGKKTVALITDMNQPLGCAVGNSLEIIEAIETLKGNGPKDIYELSTTIAGIMIYLGGRVKSPNEGKIMAIQAIESGAALEKFKKFINAQGGDENIVENYDILPKSKFEVDFKAVESGYLKSIDAKMIGLASQKIGAGRMTKDDKIDLSAGILLSKKVGNKISKGDKIATLYGNDKKKLESILKDISKAFIITQNKVEEESLVKEILGF